MKPTQTHTPPSPTLRMALRALVLLVALAASVITMTNKEGWHIDEIATLGLANGSQGGYITAYDDARYGRGAFIKETILGDSASQAVENIGSILSDIAQNGLSGFSIREKYLEYCRASAPVWKKGYEFAAYLLADGFSLQDVYINQILDTHPPLYYIFIRAAYSIYHALGGKTISLWPAFWVNALFLCGCCLMLVHIGEKRFGSLALGAGSALFFALCPAGLSLGVYMRMYMALCFFVLMSLDAHLALWQNGWKFDQRHSVYIAISCALGFLTHYYYAIWALMTALVCFALMCAQRCPKRAWGYIGRMAAGVCCTLVVWPFSVVHLLLSNRSAEAMSSLSGGTTAKIVQSALIFVRYCFGTPVLLIALAVLTCIACALLRRREKSAFAAPLMMTCIPAALYLLIVFVISPYEDLRYMACAVPLVSIAAAFYIWRIARLAKGGRAALCCALCVCVAVCALIVQQPMYLYPTTRETKQFVEVCEGKKCVYLTSTGAAFFREMPDFAHYDEVLIVNKAELKLLAEDEKIDAADEFVLYIHDSYSQTDAMHIILDLTGYTGYEVFAQSHLGLDARAYLIKR